MRDFPEILEGVVLDGANSLSKTSWAQDRSESFQMALNGMAALCAERPACTEAYGDLNALIDAAIAQFDNGPLTYLYQDAGNPDITVEVKIGLDDFAEFIKGQFGFLGNFGLPLIFQSVSEGNLEVIGTQTALGILGSRDASSNFPILMQLAMVCSDDPVATVFDADAEGLSALALAAGRNEAKMFLLGCPLINVQQLPDSSDVDVSLDVPTLLLGGGLDTRTPISRNQEVADSLPNARLVIFPTGSHVQVPNIPCANAILADFVTDPSALQTLDITCIAEFTEAFEFALPE
jgi:pimeloyl-ACP methyl ester carboxylesterase